MKQVHQRIKIILASVASMCILAGASGCSTMGTSSGTSTMNNRSSIESHISSWPMASRKAAGMTMDKYGLPQEVTITQLQWNQNGPWKRTIVYREEVKHDFPMAHTDVMEQFINYQVPPDKFDDLAMYDGSVVAERTKGEMSARCDVEAFNILALNLADEIIKGRMTLEEAHATYAQQAMAKKQGQTATLTESLKIMPMTRMTNDPDQAASMKER